MYRYGATLVRRVSTALQGMRRLQMWQRGLAAAAALVLLMSLLWLVPWPAQRSAPGLAPQPAPTWESVRTGEGVEQTIAPIVGVPDPPRPAPPLEASGVVSGQPHPASTVAAESAEALDTQAMQQLLTRLDASRRVSAEPLDTQAMDNLLTRLDTGARAPAPLEPRPRVVKRSKSRSLPRTARNRGTHTFSASPQHSDPALASPARELSWFDARPPTYDAGGG